MNRTDRRDVIVATIEGTYIALQAHQKMIEGRGAFNADDMRRCLEDAQALAWMYEEAKPHDR